MPKCTILIDNHLSPAELQLLLNAISLFRGVQDVTLENEGNVINGQPLGSFQDVPQPTKQYNSDEMLDPDTQRYFIDEVIRWAVKKKHLQLGDVRSWSPEEIVSQAVEIFESMPEQEKIAVGQNVSKLAERIIINKNQ